ncbi:prephenate dehydrogenase/arogenate dehydrogenase family protein, partial [Pseudoxanthobacter sp.]|uniref:prephenate dehydrogenase/arogenate dehydrogenase family protein n=1 Tax=Pseudoxanthobacter sp. TaxID=1925742 RepID=UPI002FE04017
MVSASDPAATPALFRRIAIVGIGLIGSSLARAALARGLAAEVALADSDPAVVARAEDLGIGTEFHLDAAAAARGADLVVSCVPVGACGSIAAAIAPVLRPGAIVSDVGSVKGAVIERMGPHLPPGVHFVPAHPVAGTEFSGPDAGFAELFEGRWSILTPPAGSDPQAVAQVQAFWEAMGANVEVMTAEHHDLVLAITSHLPHLIAYNIVRTAA